MNSKKRWIFILLIIGVFLDIDKGWGKTMAGNKNEQRESYCEQVQPAVSGVDIRSSFYLKDEWSNEEKWVWKQVCRGEVAKFSSENNEKKKIRSAFLKTIILAKPYRNLIGHNGVRISGARFEGPLDLSGVYLIFPLILKNSLFDDFVILSESIFDAKASFQGSEFKKPFLLNNLRIGRDLILNKVTMMTNSGNKQSDSLNLMGARIGDQLDLRELKTGESLNLQSIKIKDCLLADKKEIGGSVNLKSAKIQGCLSLVKETLNMKNLETGGDQPQLVVPQVKLEYLPWV